MDIDKIIRVVRELKEEGGMVSGGITNSLGQGKIAGTVEAGDNPPVFKKKDGYRQKYAKGGRGSRKWWLQFLKGR